MIFYDSMIFCLAEICAYLAQREPEEDGQNNCKRPSSGLFPTTLPSLSRRLC